MPIDNSTITAPASDRQGVPLDLDKIKRLRMQRGMTQAQAAVAAGLPNKQAWYKIESGYHANVTLQTLEAVARALGVPAKDLLK